MGLRFFLSVVQDCVWNDQALDGAAADNVRVDDFVDVRGGYAAVPDSVWIHHYRGADLALLQASGLIRAHSVAGNSALAQLFLEGAMKFRLARRIAAAARVAVRALVGADENVFFKFSHGPFWKYFSKRSLYTAFGRTGFSLSILSLLVLTETDRLKPVLPNSCTIIF